MLDDIATRAVILTHKCCLLRPKSLEPARLVSLIPYRTEVVGNGDVPHRGQFPNHGGTARRRLDPLPVRCWRSGVYVVDTAASAVRRGASAAGRSCD